MRADLEPRTHRFVRRLMAVVLILASGCGPTAASPAPATDTEELALRWSHERGSCAYASFDVPGGTDTNGFGVNDLGQIVGRGTDPDGGVKGFLRDPPGNFETLEFPGSTFTAPIDINNLGVVVGRYVDQDGVSHGFTLRRGHYETVDYPGAADTRVRGIDDRGRITGNFRKEDGVEHGFTPVSGKFSQVDVPGSVTTDVWDLNDLGVTIGDWVDDHDGVHAWV